MSRMCDYAKFDPIIIDGIARNLPMTTIARELGCCDTTVARRMRQLRIQKPKIPIRHSPTIKRYQPPVDDRRRLAELITVASDMKRRTGVTSEKIINIVFSLESKGNLNIKRVAM